MKSQLSCLLQRFRRTKVGKIRHVGYYIWTIFELEAFPRWRKHDRTKKNQFNHAVFLAKIQSQTRYYFTISIVKVWRGEGDAQPSQVLCVTQSFTVDLHFTRSIPNQKPKIPRSVYLPAFKFWNGHVLVS
jgi:hypothetical protein